MHAIQVHEAPVVLKRTLSPGFTLLGGRLVETAAGTSITESATAGALQLWETQKGADMIYYLHEIVTPQVSLAGKSRD